MSMASTKTTSNIKPPVAKQIEHRLEKFGDIRNDEYYWLKERKNPKVIQYLKDENSYLKKSLPSVFKLQQTIFKEMKSRLKDEDSTFPVKDGDYYYYSRFDKGSEYPVFIRKKDLHSKQEEIVFDINQLSKGHDYYSAHYNMSPDGHIAALTIDTVGRRFYTLQFKDMLTGKMLPDQISDITDNVIWAADNQTVFYTQQDPETLRWSKIYRYNLKEKKPVLVYEEKQDTFDCSVSESLSRQHIFISTDSTLSSEVLTLPAAEPTTTPKILISREPGHEFSTTEDDQNYYIVSNKNSKDFEVFKISFADAEKAKTNKELFAKADIWVKQRNGVHIDDLEVFKDFAVVVSREKALVHLEVINKKNMSSHKVDFADTAYSVELTANTEYNQNFVRYAYDSLRTPPSIYDYNFVTQTSALRKTKEVSNYDAANYISERIWATARDGKKIPISLLRKKDTPLDSSAPLLIYGYGSYGSNLDPWFSPGILSLVNRGFVFAIAHVRGGGELGREWTDEGRKLNKKNTFFDFIDCTEYLIQQKYANTDKIFAMGGSAGGLLMGAIVNMRPDLYRGIIAQVPFVDILTTMLDDSIPLTTSEYDEWGNPNDKTYYDYIKSYSPYDNVRAQNYPALLIETSLHDSQVQYWEPAKWTARLRRLNTSKNPIYLKTDMSAGHSGKTGRYKQLEDDAFEYAFILQMLQMEKH